MVVDSLPNISGLHPPGVSLPKRNYGHEKRQKELKRQRKKEEKLQRKLDRTSTRAENADPGETTRPELSKELPPPSVPP